MTQSDDVWRNWPSRVEWNGLSPKYAHALLVALFATGIPAALVIGGFMWLWWEWGYALAATLIALGIIAWQAIMTRRRVRAWGFAEREDDLLIRHGIWTRRLSIVPYGRMQFIDISAGPFDRMFGLVSIKLHTAAAGSDSTVPGLSPDIATGLRDRLAHRAKSEREGL